MKIPNILTIGRIIIVPIFVLAFFIPGFFGDLIPFFLFILASFTDYLDGLLARLFKEESKLGELLDPIADKILIISTTLALTYVDCGNPLPIYYTTLIVARESIQISGAISIGIISGDITIKHHWTGKIATFLQILMVYCSLTLESVSFCFSLSLLTSFFAIWSAIMYIHNGLIQLPSTHDASSNK